MTTYLLAVGMALAVGCGHDGGDLIKIFNMPVARYATEDACRAAGKTLDRGYRCTKELE